MINWFLTRVPRQFNGGKTSLLVGTTEYPHVKNELGLLPHTNKKINSKT